MRPRLILTIVTITWSAVHPVQAQWWPRDYMQQSLDVCFDYAHQIMCETNYGFGPQISLVGSFMSIREHYPLQKHFAPNTNYLIIAAGDLNATDVDIRVLHGNGLVFAEDVSYDREAIVEFNSGRGGPFTIEVELYAANADSFVSFVILQEGGWRIPRHDFNIAANEMFRICHQLDSLLEAEGRQLHLNREYRQACLFGGLMGGAEGTTLTNLQFGSGDTWIIAAGDSDVEDIDLELFNRQRQILASDLLIDPFAILHHRTRSGELYRVRLTSAAATGTTPTFCIVGLLQAR